MRKKDDALKENLLSIAKEIAIKEGPNAISIRALAKKADIAVGTVYNYFSGKDEILLNLTAEYWKKALINLEKAITTSDFDEAIDQIYDYLIMHISSSASVLMNSLNNLEQKGQQQMSEMVSVLKNIILSYLKKDIRVKPNVWNENFKENDFAEFITKNILLSLRARQSDINFMVELVKITLY